LSKEMAKEIDKKILEDLRNLYLKK